MTCDHGKECQEHQTLSALQLVRIMYPCKSGGNPTPGSRAVMRMQGHLKF